MIYMLLETLFTKRTGGELRQVLKEGSSHEGLPLMLGYKQNENFGEILLAHSGGSLDQWINLKILPQLESEKVEFACEMVR